MIQRLAKFFYPGFFKLNLVVVYILLGLAATSQAGATAQPVLTLDQAVQLALEHNQAVAIAQNKVEKAKLAEKMEKINMLPKAEITGQEGKEWATGREPQNYQVQLGQTFPTKFHLYGYGEATALETKVWDRQYNEEAYRASRAEVIYNTTTYYYNVVKTQKAVAYQEAAVNNAKEAAAVAQKQLELGKITKTSQLTAENDWAKARYELAKARQDYLSALKQLAQQMGVSDLESIRVTSELKVQSLSMNEYEKMKNAALIKRPEIEQGEIDVTKARQTLAEAKNNSLPALNLKYLNREELNNYSLSYNLLSGDVTWATSWQGTNLEQKSSYSSSDLFGSEKRTLSLNLTWTLDFGSTRNLVNQAELDLKNAVLTLEQTRETINLEMDQAWSAYELAIAQSETTLQAIPLYQKELELKQLQHRLGQATELQVKQAELNLCNARTEVEQAQCDLATAAVKLQWVLGLLDEEGTRR
ncbi:MAG TPA: TolC family protein [Bacillota bacterium]|nr:TolC family protein [Bacillota bacterium]